MGAWHKLLRNFVTDLRYRVVRPGPGFSSERGRLSSRPPWPHAGRKTEDESPSSSVLSIGPLCGSSVMRFTPAPERPSASRKILEAADHSIKNKGKLVEIKNG